MIAVGERYLGEGPQWFKEFCIRHHGPKKTAIFTVIDSKDETVKLTDFTLKFNSNSVQYTVTASSQIQLDVPELTSFTIQILDAEGYVDGAANTYTYSTLNDSYIGMTKQKVASDAAEFKLDWNLEVSQDLDSHMVIKDQNGEIVKDLEYNEAHIYFGHQHFANSNTSADLDIDNVMREGYRPPEIMSINRIEPSYTYYYYVHDFSETGQLPQTNLNLNVVLSNETVTPPIAIPTAQNANSFWNVCKIQNGILTRASDCLAETVTQEPNLEY